MYSRKVNQLDELHGILDPRVIEVLRNILGRSAAPIRHDGPVVMGAMAGGKYGDNELLEGSDLKFNGRALGTVRYGVATGDSEVKTNARTGKDVTWVEVQERKNQYGEVKAPSQPTGTPSEPIDNVRSSLFAWGAGDKASCGKWGCSVSGGTKIDIVLAAHGDSNVEAEAGDVIPFIYDIDGTGIAVGATGVTANSREKLRWAMASEGWQWVTGYSGMVGQVQGRVVDDMYGAGTAGEAAATYYLRNTSGGDPNVQVGDIFGWMLDETGLRIAVTDYLDAKIGDIEIRKPGQAIKRGWGPWEGLTGRFLVGAGTHAEYQEGATGGSHPITPAPHDPSQIGDHPAGFTSTNYANLRVLTTSLTTDPAFLSAFRTDFMSGEVQESGIGNLEIPSHFNQTSPQSGDTEGWLDAVAQIVWPNEGLGATTTNGDPEHNHYVTVGSGVALDPNHYPNDPQHGHEGIPHDHGIKDTIGHAHDVSPKDHAHSLLDNGHAHWVPATDHSSATLYHATEDFRPPWMAIPLIIRLGPEDD